MRAPRIPWRFFDLDKGFFQQGHDLDFLVAKKPVAEQNRGMDIEDRVNDQCDKAEQDQQAALPRAEQVRQVAAGEGGPVNRPHKNRGHALVQGHDQRERTL